MTKTELKTRIDQILVSRRNLYNSLKEAKNQPIIKEAMSRTDAEIVLLLAVHDALNNNNALLNTYTN